VGSLNIEFDVDGLLDDVAALDNSKSLADLRAGLRELEERRLCATLPQVHLEFALAALATASEPEVRAGTALLIEPHLPAVWARDLVCGLMTDPNDIVCMAAMRVAGRARMEEAAHYLVKIIGLPSRTSDAEYRAERSSPVGRGAAIASEALQSILGTGGDHGKEFVAEQERKLLDGLPVRPPQNAEPPEFDYAAAERWLLDHAMPDDGSMCLVPGGLYTVGLEEPQVPDRSFAWRRATPAQRIWLPPFLIDRTPVLVEEYDAWVTDPATAEHDWCHPLETPGKDHRRNTRLDPRVGPDHPVTAVDWYDAASYARAHHKELPTEYQWEVAARGPGGTVWPWGDHWDPAALRWFGSSYESRHADPTLARWRAELSLSSGREVPAGTTASVRRDQVVPHGFGLVDMSGNCWEWTKSELRGGGPYSPTIDRYLPGTTSVVIKGGAWASLRGQLYPAFRGQDAPFCRHDEIGFRCVRQIPFAVLKRDFLPASAVLGRQHY
jgi:iron(II)-dependent oxidoreductase